VYSKMVRILMLHCSMAFQNKTKLGGTKSLE
jgi:hypothetical protein